MDEDEDPSSGPSPLRRGLRSSSKRHNAARNKDLSDSREDILINSMTKSHISSRRRQSKNENAKPSSFQGNRSAKRREAAPSKPARKPFGTNISSRKSNRNDTAKLANSSVLHLGGKISPWHTLPYEILLQIFQYASYPLVTETFEPSSSTNSAWLLRTALICKGFAEPALSALYYAPPLCPPSRAHKLLAHLINQGENSFLNYRAKIRYVDLEADEVLCRKHEGLEPVDLGKLLSLIPQVRAVGIHLLSDQPVFHKSTIASSRRGKHVAYKPDIFCVLTDHNMRLAEWTWNGLLMHQSHVSLVQLLVCHHGQGFQSLRSLAFYNFNRRYEVKLAIQSTNTLPHLRSLKFRNVAVDRSEDLQILSRTLEVLEFTKCPSLRSSALAQFLKSHGGNLRVLVLDHNDALDLSFLGDLAISCPNLTKLKMDLRFFNTHFTYNDSEPKFTILLPEGVIPTWPSTLQCIELFHLRKWDASVARTFFSSLVDSAERLPDLRHISIKASIGESNWRDRISFRNEWVSRIEKVFRRVPAPPDSRLRSISTFNAHRQEFRQHNLTTKANSKTMSEDQGAANKFSHVQVETSSSNDASNGSDIPLASKRRSTRLSGKRDDQGNSPLSVRPLRKRRKRVRNTGKDSSSEEDSALEDLDGDGHPEHGQVGSAQDLYIQGMCDVVHVGIDNLRPTEEHLDESYFLDDELSGDEDWNEDMDEVGGEGYAW
ncbi:MAG: hypothetical protein Q9170_005715 [Blastenia crenularia]